MSGADRGEGAGGITLYRCRTKREAERVVASDKATRFAGPTRVPVVMRHVGRQWQGGPEAVWWDVKLVRRTASDQPSTTPEERTDG